LTWDPEGEEWLEMEEVTRKIPEELPLLPLSDSVIFPKMVAPLVIKDKGHGQLVDEALKGEKLIAVSLMNGKKRTKAKLLDIEGISPIGTACVILKLNKGEEGTVVVVQGLSRIQILSITQREPYLKVSIKEVQEIIRKGKRIDAMALGIQNSFEEIIRLSPHLPQELLSIARGIEQPGTLADMVTSVLNLDLGKKQEVLEALDIKERLKKASLFLSEEVELLRISKKIQDQVRKGIDKSQKEYYLREQLRAIQKELGLEKEVATEVEELRVKLQKKGLPEYVMKAAEEELSRLAKMAPSSPEYVVSRTYIQWILDLPWTQSTKDRLDIKRAERILNKYHYDLEKLKKRILEYLAVRKLNPNHKGPILCLVGPPGTGKTSLGRAVAEALGRRFVRVSLGGVRDEAEIRGHRRTYIGSLPGRIIQGMKKAGANNPVFMLDEVDKIGLDFRGDPASALLEVLDPEQNVNFSDHYLELEFDLSKVIFITTANHLDPIPHALRDRFEVLELSGYTEEEKLQIAQRFIIPRQMQEHGLTQHHLKIAPMALRKIIQNYTREAGVRNLEREISAIMRKVAKEVAAGNQEPHLITPNNIEEYLGKPKFTLDQLDRVSVPGVAVGLAWTPSGGDILFVEATMMPGKKELVLTGQLGEVMKESARAALSYLKSNYKALGLSESVFGDHDIHIHVPAGAIPKDGPSAGITLLTALASLFKDKPVKPKLAMTGEVTLRGIVLPVGGIKEKILAAIRSGVKEVIIPVDNKKDLDEIPKKILSQIRVHLVKEVPEVLKIALDGA